MSGIKKIVGFKVLALGILILLSVYNVFSQPASIDSLQILLAAHRQNDTTRVNLLNELARQLRVSEPPKADPLVETSMLLSDQLRYGKGKGNALAIKGARYYDQFDKADAYKAFEDGQSLLEKANDKSGLAYLLWMKGNVDMDSGKYPAALDNFLRSLALAQQSGDIKQVIATEGTIGYFYNMLGAPDKAISYQNDALTKALKMDYKLGLRRIYSTIGKTYKTQGNYQAALKAYESSLKIDRELRDSNSMMVNFSNLADVNDRMGNYEQAFCYIKPAVIFYRSKNTQDHIAYCEWVLGRSFLHSGDADSALYYGKHSLFLANKIGWRLYLRDIAELIAQSAAKLKRYEEAFKFQLLSNAYTDTLAREQDLRKTVLLEIGNEVDKKQAQIALLTKDQQLKVAENKRERLLLYFLLAGLSLVTSLTVVLLRNNKLKQKANLLLKIQKKEIDDQKQKVEQTLEELRSTQSQLIQSEKEKMIAHHHKELLTLEAKALRAQMNPHFIYNCLNSVKALMQQRETEKGITYLTTFSKLIRTLFHNSDKRQVSLYDEIETCKLYTQLESMRLNGKLQYTFCIDPNIDLKSVMVPALIVQPFIENSIWHGIVPKDGGAVNISVKANGDMIICEVDDNGIGREMSKLNKPVTPIIHESKGVHLSQQRLNLEKMLNDTNASIEIIDKYENSLASGTKVRLRFDLN